MLTERNHNKTPQHYYSAFSLKAALHKKLDLPRLATRDSRLAARGSQQVGSKVVSI